MVCSHVDRAVSEPQASELLGIALPLLGDAHVELQEHLRADERLDLRARARADGASREPCAR
jgi:hypothetical protein